MTEYKFKVGDKVKQNGKGIPYEQNAGLVGTVASVNYGKDRGDFPVNQVWVDFGGYDPCYYRDFELDLVEVKQDFVAFEDLLVGESYILQDTSVYSTPKVGDVVFVTWLSNGSVALKNTAGLIPEHTSSDGDGNYHLYFCDAKLTKIPETATPKAETNMDKYVNTTTEVIPAQTKVTKTINKSIDSDGPGFCNLSIVPDGKALVDIVVGAEWFDRSAASFTKKSLGKLIGILKEVHEAMESF